MKKLSLLTVLFLAVLALLVSSSVVHAQSWYDLDWEYRKAIIIDADKVAGNLTDFPLLVNITDSDLQANALATGGDILFTANDGTTKLDHEVESYDDGSGSLVSWVRIPNLSSTVNTVIYLYYGNPAASPQENPTAVWDNDYVMVQHLEETSGNQNDSTTNGNDGSASVTTQGSATGQINGSDEFDGVDDTVNCGNAASLDITGSMTVEAWAFSAGGTTGPVRILSKDMTGTPGKFILWKNSSGDLAFIVADNAVTPDPWYRAQGDPVADGAWFHVVGVFDADNQKVRLYKDGALVVEVAGPVSLKSPTAETVTIGSSDDNDHNWAGIIDEARISSTARSAEWIETSYNNQSDPGSFYNIIGSTGPPAVWVDDDYCDTCGNDGHLWGYDAFDNIKDAVDSIGSVASTMQSGADRLTALQNDDGGWDWPLDDGNPSNTSPVNTIGPIAMGLAQAYLHTGDPAHLAALQNAGALLLTKTNNFSPSDGYLAAILDQVLGVSTFTDHVTTNFYDELAAGTYDRNGAGTLYDTAGYVQLIRDARANGGIGNLAAWDIGMGLVGAASVGASTSDWIAGVKAEIDELDGSAYYDVIGLAGAVYGLAFVDEDYDPTSGEHAAASSLSDLAAILAGYQIDGGGFTWSSLYVSPGEARNHPGDSLRHTGTE